MAKPRGQTGELWLRGKGARQYWVGRFWCDIRQSDGTTKRAKRCFTLGLKSVTSETKARADMFRMINQRERAHKFSIVSSSPHQTAVNVRCRGSYAEYVAALDLMRQGFEVFRAMNHLASVDLISMKDGHLYRVQVKFLGPKRKLYSRDLVPDNYDVLATVSADSSVEYAGRDGEKLPLGLSGNGRWCSGNELQVIDNKVVNGEIQ